MELWNFIQRPTNERLETSNERKIVTGWGGGWGGGEDHFDLVFHMAVSI